MAGEDVHSVFLGNQADMVGSGDSTCNGRLLFIVRKTFASEVGASALRHLDDNRGLDVSRCASDWLMVKS